MTAENRRRLIAAAVVMAALVFAVSQGMFRTWDAMDYLGWGIGLAFLLIVAAAVKYLLADRGKRAAERAELERLRAQARDAG